MTKPALPPEIAARFPLEIVRHIYSFVPHTRKKRTPPIGYQKALEALQKSPKRTAMDMYGLDDFVLG